LIDMFDVIVQFMLSISKYLDENLLKYSFTCWHKLSLKKMFGVN